VSFSVADGLKRTVNVIYWIWLALGATLFLYNLINWDAILFTFVIGILIPTVLRIILFYIIDGFFK
jgi:hypothetical protein